MRSDPWKWKGCGRKLALTSVLALSSSLCMGKVYLTQEAALKSAFPPPIQVERRTLFLSEEQASAVEREAGSKITGRVFSYYVGSEQSGIRGYAYFDTHPVRTLPETVMVLLASDGAIRRVEILSFSEPEDYFPREAWLGQFAGRSLDADLAIRRGIRNLSGASLTAESITAACRRILALHRLAMGSK
ncbi:MAG: FMN-binding protein [Acidobacteria bacterium]|nr:FMN-binding protein [Acidobacteriota bacterium]MCI0567941.1 FMN-binding protein [Acidobacteriota bacterium]